MTINDFIFHNPGILVLSIFCVLIVSYLLAKFFPVNPDKIDWD